MTDAVGGEVNYKPSNPDNIPVTLSNAKAFCDSCGEGIEGNTATTLRWSMDHRCPVVYVGRYDSQCSACGGNADPHESGHYSGGPSPSMYAEGSSLDDNNGCGVAWKERKVVYAYIDFPSVGGGETLNLTDMSKPLYKRFDLEVDSD